jgi:SAM-dependent methyltransferase
VSELLQIEILIPRLAFKMEDNRYRKEIFLSWLQDPSVDPVSRSVWVEHQNMQFSYLKFRGLRQHHRLLDVGCGPLRLGAALLPYLVDGWYFGHDINLTTLALGKNVLERLGIASQRFNLIASDDFTFTGVEDESIDVAFSNSLFSHLTMNSILRCLLRVRAALRPGGVYYSTFFLVEDGAHWNQPVPRTQWGISYSSQPSADPYHYTEGMMADLARQAGFTFQLDSAFHHPAQTMGVYMPIS